MPTFKSLRSSLQSLRPPETQPLMTDDDILRAIRSAPTLSSAQHSPAAEIKTTPTSRFSVTPWLMGAGSIVVLAIAWLLIREPHNSSINTAESVEQHVAPSSAPSNNGQFDESYTPTPINHSTTDTAADSSNSQTNTLDVRFLQPSAQTLRMLGLDVSSEVIRYIEGPATITINTAGINAKNATTPSLHLSPRHISLYRKGKVFASWYHATSTPPNDLVPIHITLSDPNNTLFPSADVVLWYEPSEDFLQTLPPTDRSLLVKELSDGVDSSGLLGRRTTSSTITQSTVYPNPVHGNQATIEIVVGSACITTASVVDIAGRTVLTAWSQKTLPTGKSSNIISSLDVLPNGMYMVVVQVDGQAENIVQRLLIER